MGFFYLLMVVPSQVLHDGPDLVRVACVVHNVLDDSEDSGRVHPQSLGHLDTVDLDR